MINEFRGARLEVVKDDNKYSNHGVEVVFLSQFGDAWAAGLREGDIIVEVNHRSIAGLEAFKRATSASVASSKSSISAVTVVREGRRILMFL
jgi:S1-C subfamily serine protease